MVLPSNDHYRWPVHVTELLRKNLIVARRRPKSFALFLLAPAALVLLLMLVRDAVDSVGGDDLVGLSLDDCRVYGVYYQEDESDPACHRLAYAPSTDADTVTVMESVASRHDVSVRAFDTAEAMAEYMMERPGYVEHCVNFQPGVASLPDVSYEIWYNVSSVYASGANGHDDLLDAYKLDGRTLAVQLAVDEAVLSLKLGSSFDYSATAQAFAQLDGPLAASVIVVYLAGPAFITIGAVSSGVVTMLAVTDEKSKKLVGVLRLMGLTESAYWLSWMLAYLILAFCSGLLTTLMGLICNVYVWSKCDFWAQVLLSWWYVMAFTALCMCASSVLSKPRSVNTFCIILYPTAILVLFLHQVTFGYNFIYEDINVFFQFVFWILPWTHYGSAFDTILDVTSAKNGEASQDFTWAMVGDEDGVRPGVGGEIGNLVLLTGFYLVMAWYCGQVFSGDDGGTQPWYFPVLPQYWGFYPKRTRQLVSGDTVAKEQQLSATDGTFRLHKLSKAYDKVTALREVNLTLQRGEVLALLGANGAGKSTLINVISGMQGPTHGNAFAFGLSIRDEMPQLRSIMGSCPQDSVLWDEMTAWEHVFLFSRLKGATVAEAKAEADSQLAFVHLTADANNFSMTFSGGMKRRLSVAMASVRSPQILFLDEPTTGMDPLSRQRVWSMIEQLKQDRIVVLTTHSMEEADVLGDRIAIMSKGSIRAIGSSLFLKNRFGASYQITVLASQPEDNECVGQLRKLIGETLPGAELVGQSGGQLTVGLSRRVIKHVPAFFRAIEGEDANLVKEWGISNSSLEEVFLRLVSESNTINATAVDFSDQTLCAICQDAPTESVTVYTKAGVAVTAPDLLCLACALGETAEAKAEEKTEEKEKEGGEEEDQPQLADWGLGDMPQAPPRSETEPSTMALDQDEPRPSVLQAAKTRPPMTVSGQAVAIVLRNLRRDKRQKRANRCRICFMIFAYVQLLVFGLLSSEWYEQAAQLCPGPLSGFDSLAAQYIEADTCLDLAPTLGGCPVNGSYIDHYCCEDDSFLEEWEDHTTSLPLNYENITMAYCVSPDTYSSTPWDELDTLPLGFYLAEREFMGEGNYWYSHMVSGFDASWYGDGDWWSRYQSKPRLVYYGDLAAAADLDRLTVDDTLQLTELSVTPRELVMASQLTVEAEKYDGACGGSEEFLWTAVNESTATFQELFPDYGLHVQSAVSGESLAFTLNFYDSPSGDSEWQNTRVAENDEDEDQCIRWNVWGMADWRQNDIDNDGGSCDGWAMTNQENRGEYSLGQVISALTNAILPREDETVTVAFVEMPVLCFKQASTPTSVFIQQQWFPMVATLMLPVFVHVIVSEKNDRLYTMQRIEGMHASSYWVGMYLYGSIIFSACALSYVGLGYLAGISTYENSSFSMWLALILCWNQAQLGLGLVIAAAIPSPRFASIFSVIFMVLLGIMTPLVFDGSLRLDAKYDLVPVLAFGRAISLILRFGGASIPPDSELGHALGSLFGVGVALMVFGVYLHAVVSTPGYVGEHPLFFVEHLRQFWRKHAQIGASPSSPEVADPGDIEMAELGGGGGAAVAEAPKGAVGDADVQQERQRVAAGPKDFAIWLGGLTKIFPGRGKQPDKVVIKDLWLGIKPGEAFGLLGPNGSGKTTLINMLSGALELTSGQAYVGGLDSQTQMRDIHTFLGICPQHDCVFPDLSVREHFAFYVRAKGIPRNEQNAAIQMAAEQVALDGDAFDRLAPQLSGGMRRRLSLGIALIGDPAVVFLDEPTTGLDPESRSQVWRVVQEQRVKGRCIVITTHSMEEADALCSRIGIMANGNLQCLGTQAHLKSVYGSGFALAVVLGAPKHEPGQEQPPQPDYGAACDSLVEFIKAEFCPGVVVKTRFGRNCTFSLPRAGVAVSTVFNVMEKAKRDGVVDEWGLSQASLEEVFVRIAKAAEAAKQAASQ